MEELSFEELKQIELGILKRFDKVCRENNLQYSIAFGTMLGAVRHKGFIPWDDDIDVIMKRSDYEKLMKLKYDDEQYEIKSYRYTKDYFYPFAKMIDKSTSLTEDWRAEKNMGVYIDIFPLDYINVDADENELKNFQDKFLSRVEKWNTVAYLMGHRMMHHKALSIRFFVKFLFKLVTLPFRKMIIRQADLLNAKEKDGNYCAMLLQLGHDNPLIKSEAVKDVIYMDFEDFKAPVYSGYDYILKSLFGDYMKFPPKEEQKSNHWFKAYKKF